MSYLVATDGSEPSAKAIEYAARNAEVLDESLVLAHVITPATELVDGELLVQGRETATKEGKRVLETAQDVAAETLTDDSIDVETELLTGRAAETLAEHADQIDADRIFVGHRGLSAKREEFVGSVAKQLLRKATVPVTVVR
jgi:nucleotide-binding universal stress UspA family protein